VRKLRLEHKSKLTNPKSAALFAQAVSEGITNLHLTANLEFKQVESLVAMVRSAYLLMFHYFGYDYILTPQLDIVRDQIRNAQERTNVLRGIFRLADAPTNDRIAILKEPQFFACFVAFPDFTSKFSIRQNVGVVMPGMDVQSMFIYDRYGGVPFSYLAQRKQFFSVFDLASYLTTPLKPDPLVQLDDADIARRLWLEHVTEGTPPVGPQFFIGSPDQRA
jgi:hypothetical protein